MQKHKVKIGKFLLGEEQKVYIQSMTNASPSDVDGTVKQVIALANAGADIVRISVPSIKNVRDFAKIKQKLLKTGINIPLIADVHFNYKVALQLTKYADKIRINPGNYVDNNGDINVLKERFLPLVNLCKTYNVTLRIGANHGSLSKYILQKYGNTPKGMLESIKDFLNICIDVDFFNVVVSMKASDVTTMIEASRLLQKYMEKINHIFPQHLGVTEAGEGIDGVIKSSMGIAPLLSENIGHTIRVSLTGNPVKEINYAQKIASFFSIKDKVRDVIILNKSEDKQNSHFYFVSEYTETKHADFIFLKDGNVKTKPEKTYITFPEFADDSKNYYPLFSSFDEFSDSNKKSRKYNFVLINAGEKIKTNNKRNNVIFVISINIHDNINKIKQNFLKTYESIKQQLVILKQDFDLSFDDFAVKASGISSIFLKEKLVSGIWMTNTKISYEETESISLKILQALKIKITQPDYVSCPSCGRTLFDIEKITKEIKQKTKHLPPVSIAVMGCIVNGPGEMQNSKYGIVGASKNKAHIYKNGEIVKKNININNVVDELLKIIE